MGAIADKLKRALASKALLKQRLTEKGVDVSQEDVLYNLANKVGEIQTLPTLTNPATSKELLAGKELISGDGSICTGTMPNQGAVSPTINAGNTYQIPEGYHNGEGKVTGASLSSQTPGTASAGDLISGETAWVNGARITGSLQTNADKTYPTDDYNYLEISGTQFLAHGQSTDQTVIPVGGRVTISGHKNLLGTATPADVKKGVRFSSSAGFDLVGTMAGSPIPCEISVLNESSTKIKVTYYDPANDRTRSTLLGQNEPGTVNTLTGTVITVCPSGRSADRLIKDDSSPLNSDTVTLGQIYVYYIPIDDTSNSIFIKDY